MKLFETEMQKAKSSDAETLRLLREYTSLKNLIDSHKIGNAVNHSAIPSAPRQDFPVRHTAINPSVPYAPPPRRLCQTPATKFQYRQFNRGNSRFTLDRTKLLTTLPQKSMLTTTTTTQSKLAAVLSPSASKILHRPRTAAATTTFVTVGHQLNKAPGTKNAANQKSLASHSLVTPPIGGALSTSISIRAPVMVPIARKVTSLANQLPHAERQLSMPRSQLLPASSNVESGSCVGNTKLLPGFATPFALVRNVAGSVKKPTLAKSEVQVSQPRSLRTLPNQLIVGTVAETKKVVLGKLKTKVINIQVAKNDKPGKLGLLAVQPTKSRFKFRRSTNNSPKGTSPARKCISTTYKIVTPPKQRAGVVKVPKKRIAVVSKSSSVNSKYSWCSTGGIGSHTVKQRTTPQTTAQGGKKEIRRRVLLKSKYKLKMGNVSSPLDGSRSSIELVGRRVMRQRIRRVEQFSLNYVAAPTTTGVLSRRANLVSIGGIIYKSSQTKLTKKSDEIRCIKTSSRSFTRSVSAKKEKQQHVPNRLVTVRGIKFVMDSSRKVLQRIATGSGTDLADAGATSTTRIPNLRRIDIGRETYLQSTHGVLVKSASNQTRTLANRFKNRSLTFLKSSRQKAKQYCLFYNKFGKCSKRDNGGCPYIHDSDKIKVCKRFLREGKCLVAACPFTHKLCPLKMPVCTFFLLGRCTHDSCTYRHVNVNPGADVCLDYTRGHCPLGERCRKWHADVCPQFGARGTCDRGDKCSLPHRRKTTKNRSTVEKGRTDRTLKRPEPEAVSESSGSEDSPTKRPRLPSFISIADTTADASPDPLQSIKNAGKGLQIRPDFLKRN